MSEANSTVEVVSARLRGLHVELQVMHAGVVVAAAALHYQNAERDEEIARVLEFCVGARLSNQIERTAELIASLSALPVDPGEIETWDPRPAHSPQRGSQAPK